MFGFISAGLSIFSALQGGGRSSGRNAADAERNAAIARDQALADSEAQQRHARQVIGGMRANYGASGVTLEGSAMDVLESSAALAELDRQNILYDGELRAMGYQSTAVRDRDAARAGELRGYTTAASRFLTGAAKDYASQPDTSGGGADLGTYNYDFDGL